MGTGKSTLARLLKFHGFKVIQTDPMVSKVLEQRSDCQRALRKLLGCQGVVDVQTLRDAIVKDPKILKAIESTVHPAMAQHLGEILAKLHVPFVILEVPLLFEANWHRYVDTVCLLAANPLIQAQRLQKRGGDAELLKILRARQLPSRALSHRADAVIRSGLSPRQLLIQTIPALLASTPRPHKPKFPRFYERQGGPTP